MKNDDTGEEVWWDREVVDIDLNSKNQENQIFFLVYCIDEKECETEICANIENELFEITLMEDYLNNCPHTEFVDLTIDNINFDFAV